MKRLNKKDIFPLLQELNNDRNVYCPQSMRNGDLMLMPLGEGRFTGEIGKTTFSPKCVLFPQREDITLFRGEDISKIIESSETLIFGVRSCEVTAIQFVDRFMGRDGFVDPNYQSKRDKMTIITVACHEPPSDTCFCIDARAMPFLEEGFDLQLFDAGDFYIALAGSGKGEALLDTHYFKESPEEDGQRLEEIKNRALNLQVNKPGVNVAMDVLSSGNVDDAFWERLADKCINCGGCVYVCPTCTCFNIYDIPYQGGFVRRRTWDTCLHAGFTRETSGHNPRPTQGSRIARRVEHKFKFDIIKYGRSGCVGCGRCSDTCPVGLGAIEIIEELKKA